MKPLKKEIRKILCGVITYDGKTVKAAKGFINRTYSTSGTLSARIFGVKAVRRSFEVTKEQAENVINGYMPCLGRHTELENAPDTDAVLRMSLLLDSYLVTADYEEKQLKVTYYTPRNLTAFFRGLIFFARLKKSCNIVPTEKKASQKKAEKAKKEKAKKEK